MQRAQIIRFEHYLLRLRELKAAGRASATSEELAEFVGVSASRVRQDMMSLRFVGKPRSGYLVDELETCIRESLDLYRTKGMVVVGCGNLGQALIKSGIWEAAGFALRAAFDVDPRLIGAHIGDVVIQHVDDIPSVIEDRRVMAGCLTVPAEAAQAVADTLVTAGVRGIWNFAATDVRVPPTVILENQRLEQGLMTLSYMLRRVSTESDIPPVPREAESLAKA